MDESPLKSHRSHHDRSHHDSLKEKKKRKRKPSKEVRKKHSKRGKHSPAARKNARRSRYSSDSTGISDSEESSSTSSESWSSPSPKPKKRQKLKKPKDSKVIKHRSKHKKDKIKKKKKDSNNPSSHTFGPTAPVNVSPAEIQQKVQASAKECVGEVEGVEAAQSAKVKGPMTKEEYERQQSVVRRVYDPDTGRYRLVKGDGEIIEEIVSKERHKTINKQATLGDGASFQALTRKLV